MLSLCREEVVVASQLSGSGLLESDALSDLKRIHPPEVQTGHLRASSDVSNLNLQQSDGEFGIESLMAAER